MYPGWEAPLVLAAQRLWTCYVNHCFPRASEVDRLFLMWLLFFPDEDSKAQRARKGLGWEATWLREASLPSARNQSHRVPTLPPAPSRPTCPAFPAAPSLRWTSAMCCRTARGGGRRARLDTSECFAENYIKPWFGIYPGGSQTWLNPRSTGRRNILGGRRGWEIPGLTPDLLKWDFPGKVGNLSFFLKSCQISGCQGFWGVGVGMDRGFDYKGAEQGDFREMVELFSVLTVVVDTLMYAFMHLIIYLYTCKLMKCLPGQH